MQKLTSEEGLFINFEEETKERINDESQDENRTGNSQNQNLEEKANKI
jgi:hypothetical protein